jgi:GNAT superfamily N-acetyltransferase
MDFRTVYTSEFPQFDTSDLQRLINACYDEGETGIVCRPFERLLLSEVEDMCNPTFNSKIRMLLLIARTQEGVDVMVGCVKVETDVEPGVGEWGCLAIDKAYQGKGLGKHLVSALETHMRESGMHTAQLELLAPSDGTHLHKERLRGWYGRLGYCLKVPGDKDASSTILAKGSCLGRFVLASDAHFTLFQKAL